jgi:hypothetical protein
MKNHKMMWIVKNWMIPIQQALEIASLVRQAQRKMIKLKLLQKEMKHPVPQPLQSETVRLTLGYS